MGITRKLPNSDITRQLALDKAAMKISISAPADIVLLAQTQARLASVRTAFNQNLALRGQALGNQMLMTPDKDAKRKRAALYLKHYVIGCDLAAQRFETGFVLSDRTFFQLDGSNLQVPAMEIDDDVFIWGERIITGDANRIAAGKPPMLFPTIASVTAKYNDFVTILGDYNLIKMQYDNAQEAISNMRDEVDGLIVRIWNEVEAAYSEESAPSKRRNAREWGVVYVVTEGEPLSPDEFSMAGKVTDISNNDKLEDVVVRIVETNALVVTDNLGNYYMPLQPPGFYTVQFVKNGFDTKELPGVEITAGTVLTLDAQLTPATPASTGTITGLVTRTGSPEQALISVTVGSSTFTTHTLANGTYELTGVPAGTHTVTCTPDSNPADIQNQNANVLAGGTVTVNFVYA